MLASLAPDPLTRADAAPRALCATKTYPQTALRTLCTTMCDTGHNLHIHELQRAAKQPRRPFPASLPALRPSCSRWVSRTASPARGLGRVSQVPLGCGRWARAAHRRSREQDHDGTPSLIAEEAGRDPDPSTSASALPPAQKAGSRHSSDLLCIIRPKLDLSRRIWTVCQSERAGASSRAV